MLNSLYYSPHDFYLQPSQAPAFFDLRAFEIALTRGEAYKRVGPPVPIRRLLSESCSRCVSLLLLVCPLTDSIHPSPWACSVIPLLLSLRTCVASKQA